MPQTYTAPVRMRELGEAAGQSYWAVRRLVLAGIAPTAQYPEGARILADWANRYCQRGLTDEEMDRYREFMRRQRQEQARRKERGAA